MFIIEKENIFKEEIKKSRFITLSKIVYSKDEVNQFLRKVKEKYPKARHYCYAFRLLNDEGMSDDGEPSKTAGSPMLEVLKKEELVNIVVVVIRYFGGIKLGPGGLIRAYTSGVKNVLGKKLEVCKGYLVTINFPYQDEKSISYKLKDYKIINKDYTNNCTYTLAILDNDLENIKRIITPTEIIKTLVTK